MNELPRVIQEVFYIGGSLRDIYVLGTNADDWHALLTYLRVSPYPVEYRVDGEIRPLPEHVADIFALREEHAPQLRVDRERFGLSLMVT